MAAKLTGSCYFVQTMAKVQLVIFDFDGTLVDTAPDLIRSTGIYLQSKGLPALSEERIRGEIGMGLRKLIVDVYPSASDKDEAFKSQIEAEFRAVYDQEYLRSPKLFPNALEFLHDFEGKVAIVSNKLKRYIRPILQKLEVDTLPWSAIVGGDTYDTMKPHPQPFLAAMKAAGVTPEETLIVGDGVPDVAGALAVGSRCVAVEFGYAPADMLLDLGAWKSIADFDELLPLLNSIT
jgi:phosphoglycolate phosphatase